MAHVLDARHGLALLLGAGAIDVQRVEVAENELDGLEQPAGGFTLPDFPEPAPAERLDQAIARQRLVAGRFRPNLFVGLV